MLIFLKKGLGGKGVQVRLPIKVVIIKHRRGQAFVSLWISWFRVKTWICKRFFQAELTLAVVEWRASWTSVKCLGQRWAKALKQKLLQWNWSNRSWMKMFDGINIWLCSYFTQNLPEDYFMLNTFSLELCFTVWCFSVLTIPTVPCEFSSWPSRTPCRRGTQHARHKHNPAEEHLSEIMSRSVPKSTKISGKTSSEF